MFPTRRSSQLPAFTLVEILIVVIILGILAAIVIPQFGNATTDARTTSVRSTLVTIRNQIELFKAQHAAPPDISCMWTVLVLTTDTTEFNSPAPTGTKWGPYVIDVPVNPLNGKTPVTSANSDPSAGWYYSPNGSAFSFFAHDPDGSINIMY